MTVMALLTFAITLTPHLLAIKKFQLTKRFADCVFLMTVVLLTELPQEW
jgi:hypothetical protein